MLKDTRAAITQAIRELHAADDALTDFEDEDIKRPKTGPVRAALQRAESAVKQARDSATQLSR